MYIAILRGEAGPGLVRNRLVGLNISIWGPIPGLKMALNRSKRAQIASKSLKSHKNRFELVIFLMDKFQITRFLRFASQITRRFSDHPASASFCLADHPTRRNVVSRLPNTAKCRFQVTRVTKFLFPDHPVLSFASQITRRFPDHPA